MKILRQVREFLGAKYFNIRFLGMAVCFSLLFSLLTGCGKSVLPPAQVNASVFADKIEVTWSDVEGADGYRLYKKLSSDTEYRFICDLKQSTYYDTDFISGEIYSYKVQTLQDEKLSEGTVSEEVEVHAAPEIISIKALSQKEFEVKWTDISAENYRLYVASENEDWTLAAETAECEYRLEDAQKYTRLCIAAVFSVNGNLLETPRSSAEIIPRGCTITSVTRLDKNTAAILFDSETDTQNYLIFRASSRDGEYTNIGQSYENVFYDTGLGDESALFYRIQPITIKSEGLMSEPAAIGENARQVFGVPVFMYHEFVTQQDLDAGVAFDEYAIWKDEFESDLIWLRDNGYSTITTAQLAAWLSGTGTLPEKPVILTIDDGKYGVYKNAWPLLQQYNMTAVLAVIGEEIDNATNNPEKRAENPAPYCTWEEIGELSRSGSIEIISHTYTKHRYNDNGHQGANIAENETEDVFFHAAERDYRRMDAQLKKATGVGAPAQAYPYSIRTAASDRVWMRCGYSILLAGDDDSVRSSCYNLYAEGAGINYYSALTRRITRMTGTPISEYIADALLHDEW